MEENNVNVTETVEEVVSPIEEAAAEAPAEVIPSMDEFAEELKSQTEKVKAGEIVSGSVTSVSDTEVTVDFGSYTEGYIPVGEYSNDPSFNVHEDVTVGDAVKGLVLREDKRDGRIVLSKKQADSTLAWAGLQEALENRKVYSVKIASAVKGGVVGYVENIRAFIPASQLSTRYVENLETFVGQVVDAIVITADDEKKRLVLSAREAAKDKEAAEKEAALASLEKGVALKGKVETITSYGAFVGMENGLSGLVHISRMADHRIQSPKDVVKEGDEVTVWVVDVKDGKVSLSMRDPQAARPARSDRAPREDRGDRPDRPRRERRERTESVEYKDNGSASTSLASLLKGLKIDE
ncbi:MAG: S1 RNA-binding domain-containing protein [Lachnospiraceae bacterium]|nr:S1 RNA-binding domain-containing protein [Lachnospiraceae bacterium]MBQ9593684.1 S1 RNA-binding domain-containing protein [Lachnospiraceae bacterium]